MEPKRLALITGGHSILSRPVPFILGPLVSVGKRPQRMVSRALLNPNASRPEPKGNRDAFRRGQLRHCESSTTPKGMMMTGRITPNADLQWECLR